MVYMLYKQTKTTYIIHKYCYYDLNLVSRKSKYRLLIGRMLHSDDMLPLYNN